MLSGASPGALLPGGEELPRAGLGTGNVGSEPRLSGEPGTGISGCGRTPPFCSRSSSVGAAVTLPGQISPGSEVIGSTAPRMPRTRWKFGLSDTGRFGLLPVVNGKFHQV